MRKGAGARPPPFPQAPAETQTQLQDIVGQRPERVVALYEDELAYYRQPSVGFGYALAGHDGPWAEQGAVYNAHRRIAACLEPRTGQVLSWQREHFG